MNSHASHSERVYEAAQPETIIGVSQSVKAEMGCAPTPAPRVAKVPPFPAAVLVSRGTLARTQLAPAPAYPCTHTSASGLGGWGSANRVSWSQIS